jgi:flagellar basal-body rod modification protein FlgD
MTTAVIGINNLGSAPPSTLTPTGSNAMGKDQFLKLLLAQLGNQDPTQPTDNTQFIAQLAQFSSLEQAQATNTRLDSLLLATSSTNQTSTAAFIGRDVTYRSDQLGLVDSGADFQAQLAQSASTVTATITDSTGKVVQTLSLANQPAGAINLHWDGNSSTGAKMPPGTYTVKLEALDGTKNPITIVQQGRAQVTGVDYSAGYPQLIVNNLKLKMSDVLAVNEHGTAAPAP